MKKTGLILLLSLMAASAIAPCLLAEETPTTDPAASADAAATKDSIKLRVIAVNPSADKTQTVPIKIYLPKEVIPDDIIDMGELKVGFDSEKSLYYTFSDGVDLAPQETRVFEVQLEDVWQVDNKELAKTLDQTQLALKRLENTEYYDRAKEIVESIDRRLKEIEAKQSDLTISREEHIGAYRINLLMMGQIKQDIDLLEKMLLHTGAPPSIEFLRDTVFEKKDDLDRITAWKLIFGIIGFLGLMAIGFYVRWFLVLKSRQVPKARKVEASKLTGVSEQVMDKTPGHEDEEVDIEKLMEPEEDKGKSEAA